MASRRVNRPVGGINPKPWPADPAQAVDFDDLTRPVVAIVRQGYELRRRPRARLTYDGYDRDNATSHIEPTVADTLSRAGLAHHADQDRDLLDVAIGLAVQLGIEQGMRLAEKRFEPLRLLAKVSEKLLLAEKKKRRKRKASP
jgi:hypothetical protein